MIIYLSIGADNRVEGWGNIRGAESDVELDVAEDHNILNNPFIYKYSDGILTRDTAYEEELKNQPKPKTMIEILGEQIVSLKLEIAALKGGIS